MRPQAGRTHKIMTRIFIPALELFRPSRLMAAAIGKTAEDGLGLSDFTVSSANIGLGCAKKMVRKGIIAGAATILHCTKSA